MIFEGWSTFYIGFVYIFSIFKVFYLYDLFINKFSTFPFSVSQ